MSARSAHSAICHPHLLIACLMVLPIVGARADLDVPLKPPSGGDSSRSPAPSGASREITRTIGKPAGRARVPIQIGVARRGAPPVLPPADGTLPEGWDDPAPPPGKTVSLDARLGKILAPVSDVLRMPDARSPRIGTVRQDQQVALLGLWQGWLSILMSDGSQGFVPQAHVELLPYVVKSVRLSAPDPPPSPPTLPSPLASLPQGLATPSPGPARAVIEEAFRYSGVRYVWGGNDTRGVDCSGLVKNCFARAGISLPRRASQQAAVGQPVPLDQLQAGDRIYFSVSKSFDHTGIYLGNGYFIHAARSRGRVGVDHLSSPLYGRSLSAARRL